MCKAYIEDNEQINYFFLALIKSLVNNLHVWKMLISYYYIQLRRGKEVYEYWKSLLLEKQELCKQLNLDIR